MGTGKKREKVKRIGKKLLPHHRKHDDRGADEEDSNNNETQNQSSEIDDSFGTSNPYDNRVTAYNADVQQREELIRLHELAISEAKSQDVDTPRDDSTSSWDRVKDHRVALSAIAAASNKRKAIFVAPMDLAAERQSYKDGGTSIITEHTPEVAKFLFEALSDNFIFDVIDDELKRSLVNVMKEESFANGEWVMHQGETGDSFYVIAEGSAEYYTEKNLAPGAISSTSQGNPPDPTNSSLVKTSSKGSTFGGLALLYNQVCPTSILATTPLKLYKIDQRTFQSFMMNSKEQRRDDVMALLKENSLFHDLGADQLQKLADAFSWVNYKEGERIVNKGDDGSILYIVKSGEVK
eukprot:CAMPEP_0183714606 /NCGR_PEP_ID=MMETSP0737-20130205/9079_1 /TAXON_ID=385413 /ORGANISM="Thalassiosira miniscula, Strain CCMP1093" /LENGTH=350 /DNA_ID=CAMNT_0025943567 /DNA_START=154 /DNA_END=1203 /DNA_ORIENTATION=+